MKFRLHQVTEHIIRGTAKGINEIAEVRKNWAYTSIPDQLNRVAEGNVSYGPPMVVTLHVETREFPEQDKKYIDRMTFSYWDANSHMVTRLSREDIELVKDGLELFKGIVN